MRHLLMVVLVVLALSVSVATAQEDVYFPATEWRTSTPEEQGMDSAALAAFIKSVPSLGDVDSLMVVRNGYVVAEVYWHPFSRELKHEMFSASKSVLSALVGIAIDKGYIEGDDRKVLEFFPEREIENLDDNKQAITIRHLLTMRSGFDCAYPAPPVGTDPLVELVTESDATQLGLDWQMADRPGVTWRYCQINPYLISAILTRSTGMDTLAFAEKYLFAPLGITDAEWMASAEGLALGYAGLWLNTQDMAKFGYLFLNDGQWEDEQVVSAAWVRRSTNYLGGVMDLPYTGYSYMWWTYDAPFGRFYDAEGARFQRIMVSAEKNLVVVVTATDNTLITRNTLIPFFMEAIVNAVKSDEPLSPNPQSMAQLDAAVNAAANPQAQTLPALPPIAVEISGKTYRLYIPNILFPELDRMRVPDQDWQVAALGLDFGGDGATLRLETAAGTKLDVPVGLDGVYRVTASPFGTLAARGQWGTETTFILYLRFLEAARELRYTLTFTGRQLAGMVELAVSDLDLDYFNGGAGAIWGQTVQ